MDRLALIMFGKALILAAAGGIAGIYYAYRNKKRAEGVTDLRYDPKLKSHVPDDKYARFEKWFRRGLWTLAIGGIVGGWLLLYFAGWFS